MEESVPSNTTTSSVSAVLSERGSSYGDFSENARIAQALKRSVREGLGWSDMPGYMQEGVDMILSKLSRLVTGNWAHEDNLVDIQGYARLMQDRIPVMHWRTLLPTQAEELSLPTTAPHRTTQPYFVEGVLGVQNW